MPAAVHVAIVESYLDVEWPEYGAGCEIHGIPHMRVLNWDADLLRANEIAIAGPR